MRIKEITYRSRDDFHFIAECEQCGYEFKRVDGYADDYFCLVVVPNQACPKCDLNSYGETPEQMQARFAAERGSTANSEPRP